MLIAPVISLKEFVTFESLYIYATIIIHYAEKMIVILTDMHGRNRRY